MTTALSTETRPGLSRMVHESFEIWAFSEKCGNLPAGRPYKIRDCESLEEGIRDISHELYHKRIMAIRRTSYETGRIILHLYAIKKKSKGERRWHYAESKIVHDCYAEHLQDIVLDKELFA